MLNESVDNEFKAYVNDQDKIMLNVKDTKNLAEL